MPVEGLKVMKELITHSGAFITFSLPEKLKNASSEMMFDIRLLPDDDANWSKIHEPRLQVDEGLGFYQLDNLAYANTKYRVKLRMKSKAALDADEFWSPFTEASFKTKPTIPVQAPNICANCFNVVDNGNIVVYWTEVKKLYQNANNFSYYILGWDELNNEIISIMSNETSMVIPKEINSEKLLLKIFSTNDEGISKSFSQILLPLFELTSKKKRIKIRKEFNGDSYKVSWNAHLSMEVENYTILWCNQRNELPNQCDGPINFMHTQSNSQTFEASESKQFAIAPNSRNQSIIQGFEWAECTAAKPEGELIIVI